MAEIISPFNQKASLWIEGRKNIFKKLSAAFVKNFSPVIWVHCASLGEFEQGRPLMEKLKEIHPSHNILLTFFSSSGYQIQKNYSGADYIFYLPIDSKQNAKKFLEITKPSLILFIKYEFWFYYLQEAKQKNIPLLLISANFRNEQPFFKWYGSFHKKMLRCFMHLFVQNKISFNLLKNIGLKNVTISGDTRFDRVTNITNNFKPIEIIEAFCKNNAVIVAGSTWSEDDEALDHFANTHPEIKFIIAPHDIGNERLKECKRLYKFSMLFSVYQKSEIRNPTSVNTLIIDNIGMLARLYKYATICYVGGGFGGDGVHNVLEAAVYYKPVIFGPEYEKYFEAVELIETGGAISIEDVLQLEKTLNNLLNNEDVYEKTSLYAGDYVKNKTGATEKIMQFIQEKRLLTN
ncbi:MAG: 3-deoxy-D-manno-octulosonic acid transferase [Chitinophagaceae bacterium]